MAITLESRMRFLYCVNILVAGALAVSHLAAPNKAASVAWGFHGLSLAPPLALPMAGAWWAATAIVSLLGLRDPYKYSPVFLMQALYKTVFLAHVAATGQLATAPATPLAVFAGFLLPMCVCFPWGYLLGGSSARAKAE